MMWAITAILLCFPSYALSQPSLHEENSAESSIKVWKKDPFQPPPVQVGPAFSGDESPADLILSTILYSNERSSAVINGKIFRIGDEISGYKILDIKRTYVIVGRKNKSYRLELNQ